VNVNANLKTAYVLGCAAVSGLMIASAVADTTSEDANPYAVISDKNVFHLNPPPPPPSTETAKPPDLQKVMLSGFQKVGNRMKVYLAIPAKDPKDTAYLALQAGEKERDVEIVNIRADKEEVDILNTGTPMTLTVKSNGFALTGGGGAKGGGPPAPAGPGHRMPGMPPPNVPAAAVSSPPAGGNSAIVVGGGGGGNNGGAQSFGSASYGSPSYGSPSYGGGAIVSGGGPPIVTSGGGVPNSPGVQIANSLFAGGTSGQGYQVPTQPNVNPAPPEVQAAALMVHEAAGGPPAPPVLEEPRP
jgi:hypothetical protein